jgi:hypothetical protein
MRRQPEKDTTMRDPKRPRPFVGVTPRRPKPLKLYPKLYPKRWTRWAKCDICYVVSRERKSRNRKQFLIHQEVAEMASEPLITRRPQVRILPPLP